jgi:hypothetical protein
MTDTVRVDLLLKYALAAAGQEEPGNRELGAIHLVKYVYLADLTYAEHHGGETFTAASWRFHNFGPWCTDVNARIAPVVAMLRAEERRYSNPRYEDEAVRWVVDDEALANQLEDELPLEVTSAIKRAIRQFGSDTASLLHEVYRTRPMLEAAPGEVLKFEPLREEGEPSVHEPGVAPAVTPKQARTERESLRALRDRVRHRLAEARTSGTAPVVLPPRYDDIFAQGQQWLDSLAGRELEAGEATMVVDEDVWKSRGRREPGIP